MNSRKDLEKKRKWLGMRHARGKFINWTGLHMATHPLPTLPLPPSFTPSPALPCSLDLFQLWSCTTTASHLRHSIIPRQISVTTLSTHTIYKFLPLPLGLCFRSPSDKLKLTGVFCHFFQENVYIYRDIVPSHLKGRSRILWETLLTIHINSWLFCLPIKMLSATEVDREPEHRV